MIKQLRTKVLLLIPALMLLLSSASAQQSESLLSRLRIGLSTGYHANMMRFPGLSKDAFAYRDANHSGLFALAVEWDFAKQFTLRPELEWLSRGGKLDLHQVGKTYEGLYTVKAKYFDLRVPVIYHIDAKIWQFEPYVFVAPVLGFVRKGEIKLHEVQSNGAVVDYKVAANKANIASAYFAVEAGAGLRYPIEILGTTCYANLELSYEFGLTDTYTKMERNNQTININNELGPVASARRFHGVEVKVGFSVPLSLFKSAFDRITGKSSPKPKGYTLSEVKDMADKGESVKGKTIYAIDCVNFDTAKSIIKDESKPYLDEFADFLIKSGLKVEIKGHTDSDGDADDNMELSKERVLAVKAYLERRGVPAKSIKYSYYGETRPIDTNDTPEGRKRNRRVEFELLNK